MSSSPALPAPRSRRSRQDRESRRRRSPRTTFLIDGLGLHRITRQAIRELHERVERLEALVALLDSIASEVFAGDGPDQLRAATTILRTTLGSIATTATEAAVAVGQVRFVGQLRSIEIEEPPG